MKSLKYYFKKMQEPDTNGFVNIRWPSKNVPHGGIFHTKKTELSEKQQNFLKGKIVGLCAYIVIHIYVIVYVFKYLCM